MGLRYEIRGTFWFCLGFLGLATLLVTWYQEFDAGILAKPNPISNNLRIRFELQALGGLILFAAPIIKWLLIWRAARRPEHLPDEQLQQQLRQISSVVFALLAIIIVAIGLVFYLLATE